MSRRALFAMLTNKKEDVAKDFLSKYTTFVEKQDEENKHIPSKTFKPSSLKCIRASVYQVLGVEPTDERRNYQGIHITDNGSERHQAIQHELANMKSDWKYVSAAEYVRNNNIDLEIISESNFEKGIYETKFHSKKYNITFLCDGILYHRNKYYILEIKTQASVKGYGQKEPHAEHKMQAVSYCKLLQIDSVIFLYESRDFLNKDAFLFTPSEDEKETWETTLTYGLSCVDKKLIPKKPVNADKKFCQYCNYKKSCNKHGENEVLYDQESKI